MVENFASENPGTQIVSHKDLLNVTPPCFGFRLSTDRLRKSIQEVDKSWGDAPVPPKYVNVDGRYLALAQTFQALADALVERHRTGKLPESVEVLNVYGPVELPKRTGATKGEVSGRAVVLAAMYIASTLHEDKCSPIPRNSVPGQVQIGDIALNAVQYLRLMMKVFLSGDLEAKLPVNLTGMVWALESTGFRTRPPADMGAIWTMKPSTIDISKLAAKSQ